jgi:hypothetical protein
MLRKICLISSAMTVASSLCSMAIAQPAARIPYGYTRGFDGCPHRLPWAVLQGYPHIDCNPTQGATQPPPVFSLATPGQVIAALDCDFSAAAVATKGKTLDLSKAVISGVLTFSLVTKNSVGASLAVAAIPVFSAASVAPSLDATRLTNTTQSDEYTIAVDPAVLSPCSNPSTNKWLTSKVIVDTFKGINITKVKTDVTFVLTKQASAGLKLNIVPVSIGPQLSGSKENTQKVSLTFDFTAKPVPPGATPVMPSQVPAATAR